MEITASEMRARWFFFLDKELRDIDISALMLNFKKLHHSGVWVSRMGYDNIYNDITNAAKSYKKNHKAATSGHIAVELRCGSTYTWIKTSFIWELEVVFPLSEKCSIGASLADFNNSRKGKSDYLMSFIEKEIETNMDQFIISNAIVFDVFKTSPNFERIIEEFKKDPNAVRISGIPEGKTSMAVINDEVIMVLVHTKDIIPYWILLIHKYDKQKDDKGETVDYVYNLLRLIVCKSALDKIELNLSELGGKIERENNSLYTVLNPKNSIHNADDVNKLNSILLEMFRIRGALERTDVKIVDIMRYKALADNDLSEFKEDDIIGNVHKMIIEDIDTINSDIKVMRGEMESSMNSIEQAVRDRLQGQTAGSMGMSVTIESSIRNFMKASHLADMVMFVLTIVLFASLFIEIAGHVEVYDKYLKDDPVMILMFDGGMILCGIFFAILMSRFAVKSTIVQKAIGMDFTIEDLKRKEK